MDGGRRSPRRGERGEKQRRREKGPRLGPETQGERELGVSNHLCEVLSTVCHVTVVYQLFHMISAPAIR